MLKLNVEKTSLEELAKKYNLVLDETWQEHNYLLFKNGGEAIDFNKSTNEIGFANQDVLFDMIKNGDVIKEDK